ncbi:MAG: hypothetical protein K8T91_19090 [Planctomycetes bacterium]|nr:hypothetical protein [Planctomycetota bacterium]
MAPPSTAYKNDAGRPRLRSSVVAFFDLLGYSQASTSCATDEDSQHLLDRIVASIDDSRDFVRRSFAENPLGQANRWAIKFFSDNLAFGYPFDEQVADRAAIAWFIIRCAQQYQLRMTLNGFFLRGAITQGPLCLTDEIIFGSSLVECYQLESKASIVPRVLLAEPLQALVTDTNGDHSRGGSLDAHDAICRDVDGWWFVNYLQAAQNASGIQWEYIQMHKASILDSLSHTTRHVATGTATIPVTPIGFASIAWMKTRRSIAWVTSKIERACCFCNC